MKKSKVVSRGLLVFLVVIIVVAVPTPAPTAQFTWKAQDAFTSPSMNNYSFLKLFSTLVNERSKGRIQIQHFDAGGIVPPFDIFGAVSKGTVELGTSCGAYYAQRIPETDIEYGLVYDGFPARLFHEMAYKYKDGQFMKILRELYKEKGIHYLVIAPTYGYGFMTNFPFRKVDDLQGKKIRTAGTVMTEFLKKVGAAPVSIPGADIYMALQRGTVDGITLLYVLLQTSRLAEVVKYVTFPDVYSSASLNILMNFEAYNKLPDDLKKLVDNTAEEAVYKYLIYGLRGQTDDVLEWAKSKGVQTFTLPDEEVAKIRKIIRPMDKLLQTTPMCKQLYGIRESFMKEKGIW